MKYIVIPEENKPIIGITFFPINKKTILDLEPIHVKKCIIDGAKVYKMNGDCSKGIQITQDNYVDVFGADDDTFLSFDKKDEDIEEVVKAAVPKKRTRKSNTKKKTV